MSAQSIDLCISMHRLQQEMTSQSICNNVCPPRILSGIVGTNVSITCSMTTEITKWQESCITRIKCK